MKDKTAIITGASSGIGRAIALELAQQGCALQLLGRNQAALETLKNEAEIHTQQQVSIHRLDLTDDTALQSFAEQVEHCAILVHSAGIVKLASVADAPIADLDMQYHVNVRAPFLLTQLLLPKLRLEQGSIVFINSTAGKQVGPNWSGYAASKFALRAIADSLRAEEPELRVLSVHPSRTASPMQAQVYAMEGRASAYQADTLLQPEHIASQVVHALQLPQRARVSELVIR